MSTSTGRLMPILACLSPLLLFVYFDLIAPRPFGLAEIDAESELYYAAQLIVNGEAPHFVNHPATPIYYAAAGLLALTGPAFADAQRFFVAMHLTVALITALSLWVFLRTCLRNAPPAVSALAVAAVLAWPSALTFLDYADSNSFHVPFGLFAIALFWRMVDGTGLRRGPLVGLGLMLGLCLATKLSFLPFVAAVLAGVTVAVVWCERPVSRMLASLMIVPAGTGGGFFVLTLPILDRLPGVLLHVVGARPGWEVDGPSWQALTALLSGTWPLVLLHILAGAVAIAVVVATRGTWTHRDLAVGAFLMLLTPAFVYLTIGAGPDGEPGVQLRHAAPSALAVPVLIAFCHRRLTAGGWGSALSNHRAQAAVLLAAAVVAAWPVASRVQARREFIAVRGAQASATLAYLEQLRAPGTRVAVWDSDAEPKLGAVGWHLLGNHVYAGDYFDDRLLAELPAFTLLRLKTLARSSDPAPVISAQIEPGAGFGRLGRLFRRLVPSRASTASPGLFAGEGAEVRPSLLAIAASDFRHEFEGLAADDALVLFAAHLGAVHLWTETIAGAEWLLVRRAPAGEEP